MTPLEEEGFAPSFLQKVIEEIQKTAEILGWKRPLYYPVSCIHCGHNKGYHGLVFLGESNRDTIDICNAKSWLRRKNCRCSQFVSLPCNCGHEYDDHAELYRERVCYHGSPCGPDFPCDVEGCNCQEFVTKGESFKIPDKHGGAFSCIYCGHSQAKHELLLQEEHETPLHQTHVCSVKIGRNRRCKCVKFATSKTGRIQDWF